MKISLVILLLHTLALWGAASDDDFKKADEAREAQMGAKTKYWERKGGIQKEFRDSLSAMILKADKIELLLLDFTMAEVEDVEVETFPIPPFQGNARIITQKAVQPADLESFKTAIATLLTAKNEVPGAFCHYPIHGIKVYQAGTQIFQTSLCWECGNYYVEYPDGSAIETMAQSEPLKKLFDTALPIPPEELARFKNAIEKMNSKGGGKK
jgi:hypothetical protein